MGFLSKIFRRNRKREPMEDNWEQIVYNHADVDFTDEEQRTRYIMECLEQISEASKESNLLNGEYTLVTAYLTDMEEIEALPEEARTELNRVANQLVFLEKERERYQSKKDRMPDSEYYHMRKQEEEVEEGIVKLREAEKYGKLIRQDLQRLDGERHAYEYRREELITMQANLRGRAIVYLTALVAGAAIMAVLQFAYEMKVYVGYFLLVMAAAIAVTVLYVKHMDAQKEEVSVAKGINKLVQLQNKVKIRYVNNTHLLEYLYMKYDTDSAAKLQKRWERYQEEQEERKQYAEAEAKIEYCQKELVRQLSRYRVSAPDRWMDQAKALLDPREMVEIRHSLILRRQALRKQLDYNSDVARVARNEVMEIVKEYPQYGQEILNMVERYDSVS